MPPHLTSDQVIQFLAEKKEKKLGGKGLKSLGKPNKKQKKAERERNKAEREAQHSARGPPHKGRRGRGISRPRTSQSIEQKPSSNRRKVEGGDSTCTSSSANNSEPEGTEPPSQPRVTSRVTRSTFRGARGRGKSTARLQENLVPTEELISSSEGE